jgi:hypothetical protein
MVDAYYGVDPFTFDSKFEDVAAAPAVVASGSTPSAANLLVPKPKKVAKPLADVHLSTFIRLVHGSELSRTDVQKLVKEELKTFNTTLVSIEATFKELGVTRVKKTWAVPAEMRVSLYLPDDNPELTMWCRRRTASKCRGDR